MTSPLPHRISQRPLHDPPLLRAHLRWIVLVALVSVASACVLPLLLQGPR